MKQFVTHFSRDLGIGIDNNLQYFIEIIKNRIID